LLSTVAKSELKFVPSDLLQKEARFFSEFTSLYQSPPPLYFSKASLIVASVTDPFPDGIDNKPAKNKTNMFFISTKLHNE
jgi:hypothetical protein